MTARFRRTVLLACLCALALPAGAAAAPVDVAPPGSGGAGASAAAVGTAANPGCSAKSMIEFRGNANFRVRHNSLISCSQVNVRIKCSADLFRGNVLFSHLQSRDSNRCRVGSPFSVQRFAPGTQFTQKYRYELTLKNRRQRWAGTTEKCPRRSNERRTLTCRSSHTTLAPTKSVDRISS